MTEPVKVYWVAGDGDDSKLIPNDGQDFAGYAFTKVVLHADHLREIAEAHAVQTGLANDVLALTKQLTTLRQERERMVEAFKQIAHPNQDKLRAAVKTGDFAIMLQAVLEQHNLGRDLAEQFLKPTEGA